MIHKEMECHNNQRIDKHLMMTKSELIITNTKVQLNDTKAKLDDTKAQLDTALEQINSLAVLMKVQFFLNTIYIGIASNYFRPIIDAMAVMFKSTCPVIIKYNGAGYTQNGTVTPTLTTRDTRCVFVFMLLAMVTVKVLTCRCPCIS